MIPFTTPETAEAELLEQATAPGPADQPGGATPVDPPAEPVRTAEPAPVEGAPVEPEPEREQQPETDQHLNDTADRTTPPEHPVPAGDAPSDAFAHPGEGDGQGQ